MSACRLPASEPIPTANAKTGGGATCPDRPQGAQLTSTSRQAYDRQPIPWNRMMATHVLTYPDKT